MSDCFFCGTYVGEENGDGGCKGRTVGNKDICEQCLGELKHWLNATLPRSPSMREKPLEKEDDEIEENNSEESQNEEDDIEATSDDPFSSSPKV